MLICLQPHKLVSSVVSRMLTEDTRLQGQEFGLRDSLQPRTQAPGLHQTPTPSPRPLPSQWEKSAQCRPCTQWLPDKELRAQSRPHANLVRGLLTSLSNLCPRRKYCLSYPRQQTNLPFAQGRNCVFLPRWFTTKSPWKKITSEQKCRNV